MSFPLNPFRIEREWEHAGLKCIATQALEAQHRCGYVRVLPGHPAFGHDWTDIDIDVHGGITFAGGDEEEWWIGFDCAHAGDEMYDWDIDYDSLSSDAVHTLTIIMQIRLEVRTPLSLRHHDHFWSLDEVVQETERLAEQLKEMNFLKRNP